MKVACQTPRRGGGFWGQYVRVGGKGEGRLEEMECTDVVER